MSMTEREAEIDGRKVTFKATARTPRLYRVTFGRDMMQDMDTLRKAYAKRAKGESELSAIDLTIFENVAYIMAKQADPGIPDTADEWLDTFSIFAIYEVLPVILELWKVTTATTSDVKKN